MVTVPPVILVGLATPFPGPCKVIPLIETPPDQLAEPVGTTTTSPGLAELMALTTSVLFALTALIVLAATPHTEIATNAPRIAMNFTRGGCRYALMRKERSGTVRDLRFRLRNILDQLVD